MPWWVGPFKVVCKVGLAAYELKLLPTWRIYPIFHEVLLTLADPQTELPNKPKAIEVEGHPEYEVEAIRA